MTILESLYEQAASDGIAVMKYSLPNTVSTAVCIDGHYYIGMDCSHFDTSFEEAECLAHELGHCRTDAVYALGDRRRIRHEKRAEEWAITRLIPQKSFDKAVKNGCREVWEFAEELNISCRFAEKVVHYYSTVNR